jgi:hypothetical protein
MKYGAFRFTLSDKNAPDIPSGGERGYFYFNNDNVVQTGFENSTRTFSERFWRRVA